MDVCRAGFRVLPFLSANRLAGMRQAITECLDAARRPWASRGKRHFRSSLSASAWNASRGRDPALGESLLLAVYREAHLDDRIAFLIGHAPLRETAERLTGSEFSPHPPVRANRPVPTPAAGMAFGRVILDGGEFRAGQDACWVPLAHAHAGTGPWEVVPGIRSFPMAHEGDPSHHTSPRRTCGQPQDDCGLRRRAGVFLDAFVPIGPFQPERRSALERSDLDDDVRMEPRVFATIRER